MSQQQIPFAAVASAHELELLAEASAAGGNAGDIAKRILRQLPSEPGRRSYAYEKGFSFHSYAGRRSDLAAPTGGTSMQVDAEFIFRRQPARGVVELAPDEDDV